MYVHAEVDGDSGQGPDLDTDPHGLCLSVQELLDLVGHAGQQPPWPVTLAGFLMCPSLPAPGPSPLPSLHLWVILQTGWGS